ncbi:hypothetical protein ACR75C_11275 [Thomasclavelia ramosa]|uniref:hypothetical protein n=1 Tax=Thomasclavelia ramosa TaxID=1547 RepID=UPI003DA64B1C
MMMKSILNKLNQYVEKLKTKPDAQDYISWSSTFSIVELEYRVSTFLKVLELEDYIENRDIAYSVIRLICADALEQLAEPLLEKRLKERIEFINENIKDIQITKDDILGDDLPEKYTESEYVILGLTYEQVSPLELFEDFISFYNIAFSIGDDVHLFKYHFSRDTPIENFDDENKKWYYANTIEEMIYHFSKKLMDGVVKNIIDNMSLDNNPITLSFDEYVDMNYLHRCKSPKEIYGYLKSIDLAKLSLPLHYLYLLLEFDKMTIFKD